ncbi:transglutaminase family protein [Ferrovibrio sp.]|uniref:transglutaminase family protein n=1 Tax=Ferrovibrio sp. TaxID=1917215 RepID=UPI0025BE28CD|nr:transglutaminase family protein [Ferrovibrio sp.]MBX3453809.1 transglutaminase family protein [Ferrovibrio sp.]
MSIQVALHHRTTYRYDRLINLGPQVVRLRPAPHSRTPILSYSLKISPGDHFINWQQDPQGNYMARLVFPERTDHFEVVVDLVADMAVINPFDFFLEPEAEHFPFTYDPTLDEELAPFRKLSDPGPLLRKWLASVDRKPAKPIRTVDFLVGLNQRLANEIKYLIRMEPGVQTAEQTLGNASGSCRDTSWLLVQALRHLGFAARFVSGYLIQLVADVKPLEGPEGPTADFTDLHAWCEVYLPGAGWIGFDPTSGLMAGEGHIPLAATPEPQSAAPISGLIGEAEVEFDFAMNVRRFHETPRVTKAIDDDAWARLLKTGDTVEAALQKGDVRLTMGGEPTFVSIDDMEGAEWNTAALGPNKRALAGQLIRRLADKYASGTLLHYGQGKWYPGEQLPRWALSCHWRRDGEPIWRDRSLLAADEDAGDGATVSDADIFTAALAERLQVDPGFRIPGFEDAWYYMWRERRLPVNVDPFKSRLKDPQERARLARIFEQGLDKVVGYALPLFRERSGLAGGPPPRWRSGAWFLRPQTMFLLPGDSPMGYRLPLDSLPWSEPGDMLQIAEPDTMERRPPLPPPLPPMAQFRETDRQTQERMQAWAKGKAYRPAGLPTISGSVPAAQTSAEGIVRTAICVEPRGGLLHVFMPPAELAEDYLDLIAAIEDTAALIRHKVVIEGYLPPRDPRLHHFSVTPDPGVIEVNIHPSENWRELVDRTTVLYEEARQTRLGTEKFMLDGRHVGTGGGNHVVMGAAQPVDSPFLRRPDLLRSLVGYWQNHPSLSYLFSGLFIGPTSQHPRVDEARDDALTNLAVAFEQADRFPDPPPWLVDRIFRNVLVDLTGNTHRTEFCIDKLYSPDGPTGRLGLVELRAFEMPPDARMSLAQQVLLRALMASFWQNPYKRTPVRWGTRLHDEFLLPHFCLQDFNEVLIDLKENGFELDPAWFAAHAEFRFPKVGEIAARGIELELRHALEPWHVLGEESSSGGTARYVDSSVERLQVKAKGLTGERYTIACNGRALPLRATGVPGEYVAGVRFKAWGPPSALHPTIGVHTPLSFDLFDTWNNRPLAGCSYHVAHPGGRNYDTFPVNANEAEARRRARFFPINHTPTAMPAPAPKPPRPGDQPLTLDLRGG